MGALRCDRRIPGESRLAGMPPPPWYARATDYLTGMSAFANWLDAKRRASATDDTDPELVAQVVLLSRRSPRYAALLEGWRPTTRSRLGRPFKSTQDLPPVHEDALDFTAFALDQFRNARPATAPHWSSCPHTTSAPEAPPDSTA